MVMRLGYIGASAENPLPEKTLKEDGLTSSGSGGDG
jgi:hypothetical protein